MPTEIKEQIGGRQRALEDITRNAEGMLAGVQALINLAQKQVVALGL